VSILLVEDGLRIKLKADATLATLLGATAGDSKIHPTLMEQREALPAVVYQKVSDTPEYAMGGETGLTRARIQINVWTAADPGASNGYAEAVAIAERIRMILSGFRGTITDGLGGTIQVDFVELGNELDFYDPEAGRGLAMQSRICDYVITYRQTTP
jgi:hypothetical protein